jgi:hypothetical protein
VANPSFDFASNIHLITNLTVALCKQTLFEVQLQFIEGAVEAALEDPRNTTDLIIDGTLDADANYTHLTFPVISSVPAVYNAVNYRHYIRALDGWSNDAQEDKLGGTPLQDGTTVRLKVNTDGDECTIVETSGIVMRGLLSACTDALSDAYLRVSPRADITGAFLTTSPKDVTAYMAMKLNYYNAHALALNGSQANIPPVTDAGGNVVWCSDEGEKCECSTSVYFGTWFNRDEYPRNKGV